MDVKKSQKKVLKNFVCKGKRCVYLQPLKTGTFGESGSLQGWFVFDRKGGKNFREKRQKNIAGIKKGFYICTRLRRKS